MTTLERTIAKKLKHYGIAENDRFDIETVSKNCGETYLVKIGDEMRGFDSKMEAGAWIRAVWRDSFFPETAYVFSVKKIPLGAEMTYLGKFAVD